MTTARASPVLMVTGTPGVGKSTTARVLAGRSERAVHLESDLFFRFIRSGYLEPSRPESRAQNDTVMQIVADAAAGYATAGYFTIVDGIILPDWYLDPLRKSLDAAGHRVAYAVLRAPLAVCASRAQEREAHPRADPEVVERLWNEFADLGRLERHAIDIATKDPGDVAELLTQRLRDGSLAT